MLSLEALLLQTTRCFILRCSLCCRSLLESSVLRLQRRKRRVVARCALLRRLPLLVRRTDALCSSSSTVDAPCSNPAIRRSMSRYQYASIPRSRASSASTQE